MQARAAEDLKKLVTERLTAAGLHFGKADAYVTPRRLALVVDGLPHQTADVAEEKKGPRVGSPDQAIQGFLKGAGVGAAYRWQDKNILGYNLKDDGTYDLENPIDGEEEDAVDFWISYEHKLTSKINWKIQLNVRNVFAGDELIAISRQPDGQIAQARIAPNREWLLTNTFSF